jgi:hypothetical protein
LEEARRLLFRWNGKRAEPRSIGIPIINDGFADAVLITFSNIMRDQGSEPDSHARTGFSLNPGVQCYPIGGFNPASIFRRVNDSGKEPQIAEAEDREMLYLRYIKNGYWQLLFLH